MHNLLQFLFLIFATLSQSQTYLELQSQAFCAIVNAFPMSDMSCNATYNCPIKSGLYGLRVDCADNNIFQDLYIYSSSISSIPTQIGLLTILNTLWIYDNPLLSGTIPSEIGLLSSLTLLDISNNQLLTGTIPSEIRKMSSILDLTISNNPLLSGTIPNELGELSLLIGLDISDNPLLSGTIPTGIGKMPSLLLLWIYDNPLLSGTIPSEIGLMSSLLYLWISETLLSGTIPSEIGELSLLIELGISNNPRLSGTIPTEIRKLSSLQKLGIFGNPLMSGTFPSEIGELSSLLVLNINNQRLSGTIPSEIGKMSSLQQLLIYNNPLLSGTIPTEIGNLSLLSYVWIYDIPLLSGTIPSEIGKLTLLSYIFLSQNALSGSVPNELNNCPLVMLHLSNNQLSVLPNAFPPTLQELVLSFNNFSGPLPYGDPIWFLYKLNVLDLSYNFFSGTINIYAPLLLSLDLSHNQFTGTIPDLFGLLTTLKILKLQDNQFSGTIPDALSSLGSLEQLYLNNNILRGTIPLSLPSHIQILNLQSNYLTGTIPEYLGKFKYLNSIDFSKLNICGCFPSGWANISWLSCSLTGVSYNCSCNYIPQDCAVQICDPTVNCEIADQCSNGVAKCSSQRSCTKNGYGYICGNCPSGYNSDLYSCVLSVHTYNIIFFAVVIPIILGLFIVIIVLLRKKILRLFIIAMGIVLWKNLNEIELPNSWFWDYDRINSRNYLKSNTEPAYYYTNVKERSKEKQYLDELMEKLDFGNIIIKEAIAVVSPVLAGNASGAHQIQRSRMVKNPLQFNKKDWEEKDNVDICQKVITMFESKMKAFSWNEMIEHSPVIPVVHGTDEDIAWKIASGGFAALSTLDSGFYGKGIYFSSSALYTLPYFGLKKKPAILICLTIPGNPYPVTEDPKGPKDLSLVGEHIKTGYQSHYVVTKKNGMPFQRDDYDTKQKQYDELIISQEAQVVPIFLLKVSDINLGQLVYEYQRDTSQKGEVVDDPDIPYVLF